MDKQKFLSLLRKRLSGLSREELEGRLAFYHEMIDDRMEEGLSEADAIAAVGPVDDIAAQILGEMPAAPVAYEKKQAKRKLRSWEIVLLALGSPVWFSLLVAALAVIISLIISLWTVIVSLWAAFGALVWLSAGCIYWVVVVLGSGNCDSVMTILGAALLGTGLSIFLFYGCKLATKGTMLLTKKLVLRIKQHFRKKEAV